MPKRSDGFIFIKNREGITHNMKKESDIDKLDPKRLIAVREGLGLNKSAAAKLLEMTPMAYGRYEAGQRSPSIQTIDVIAQRFGTSRAYLCGESDDITADYVILDKEKDPELFLLVEAFQSSKEEQKKRIYEYVKRIIG